MFMANFSFTRGGATPNQPFKPQMNPSSGSPVARALNGAQGIAPPIPLVPPVSAHIKSHTITHPDGTTVSQTFHPPAELKSGMMGKGGDQKPKVPEQSAQPGSPEVKVMDGKHHVPFKDESGQMKFIDSEGNIH